MLKTIKTNIKIIKIESTLGGAFMKDLFINPTSNHPNRTTATENNYYKMSSKDLSFKALHRRCGSSNPKSDHRTALSYGQMTYGHMKNGTGLHIRKIFDGNISCLRIHHE